MKRASDIQTTMDHFHQTLDVSKNFDIVYHTLTIGGHSACLYFVDGFTKDEVLTKLMQGFTSIKPEDMPDNAHDFAKQYVSYGETGLETDDHTIEIQLLSGLTCLFIDGYEQCITIDCRTYPARGVSEPEKDKVLRGSRDGFVETLIFNTALIRRRIRDTDFTIEIAQTGESSHTDIAICYMKHRVDPALLSRIKERLSALQVDALTMNQESLAECLFPYKWYNPFPKFRFPKNRKNRNVVTAAAIRSDTGSARNTAKDLLAKKFGSRKIRGISRNTFRSSAMSRLIFACPSAINAC